MLDKPARLAKHPPSAGFPSPSGGAAPSASPLGPFRCPFWKPPPSAAVKDRNIKKIWGKKKKLGQKKKKLGQKNIN